MKLFTLSFVSLTAIILSLTVLDMTTKQQSELTINSIEVMTYNEHDGSCISGGQGAISCSVDGGISIDGIKATLGCSITCPSNYYACCSFNCSCIRIN